MSEREVLRELRKISKTLFLANAPTIERELSKIATTVERKKIWIVIDGKKNSAEIAAAVGIGQRGVQKFLREARLAELVDYHGDSVQRALDYVPPAWAQLMLNEQEDISPDVSTTNPEEKLDPLGTSDMEGGS